MLSILEPNAYTVLHIITNVVPSCSSEVVLTGLGKFACCRCYLSVVQVLHGQPRVALPQTLPRKATVGQGELQAGGRQKR